MTNIRISRLAAELRMRRRRLDSYRRSPPWPGKEPAWRAELGAYDYLLLLAAEMLEVDGFDRSADRPLASEARAVLEDRLGHLGLDVHRRDTWTPDEVIEDDGLSL
jgi:hypothetical protein